MDVGLRQRMEMLSESCDAKRFGGIGSVWFIHRSSRHKPCSSRSIDQAVPDIASETVRLAEVMTAFEKQPTAAE
jgi:hypothetical protein